MAGDLRTAMNEAARLSGILDPEISSKIAWIQAIGAAPYFSAAQFARPTTILAMPAADSRLPYVAGMRHYARAVARAQQRDRTGFEQEITALKAIQASPALQRMIDQGVPARDLLAIAETVARGRLAGALDRRAEAVRHFQQAAAQQAKVPYMEPPFWYFPVQQSLGAALFQAGRYDDARQAFEAALVEAPNNGWALYGLAATEARLGRPAHAQAARAALKRAWLGDPNWLRMDRI